MAELSTNHISHVEIGSTPISLPALISICEVLDITADHILYDNLTNLNINIANAQINEIFQDTTNAEQNIMLSVALSTKDALRHNHLSNEK